MDRILLDITGIQFANGRSDRVQLTTMGTLRDDGTAYIIKYTEEQDPPTEPVNVTVRIQKDGSAVEMTRSGAFDSCLMIEKSKRNLCHYNTPFGSILMGVYGRESEIARSEASGRFTFRYDIDVNGSLASKNTVDMKFRVKRKSESKENKGEI